ncbi:hypothetical protein BJ742DRAFT_779721 [Cladochytrium replicatum]|nr:hypothetical protein BJ742DRAFT_779721 [Cladochytrium replicatum]
MYQDGGSPDSDFLRRLPQPNWDRVNALIDLAPSKNRRTVLGDVGRETKRTTGRPEELKVDANGFVGLYAKK